MKTLKHFIPAILLLFMIFGFSTQNGQQSSGLSGVVYNILNAIFHFSFSKDTMTFVIRKCAHMTEFGLLGIAWYHGLKYVRDTHLYKISLLLVFICGCLDEFHQLFIPGRAGQFRDALIDTTGGFIFLVFLFIVKHFYKLHGESLNKYF